MLYLGAQQEAGSRRKENLTKMTVSRRIHLDVLGGIAGDMFTASLLDLFPEWSEGCFAAIKQVAPAIPFDLQLLPHNDGVFQGRRFRVSLSDAHEHTHHNHGHVHRSWADIKQLILIAKIDDVTRNNAIGIFALLAEAEAACHGVAVVDVHFHEVGAWDSIADIVAAAYLIGKLSDCYWTMGALPTGRGTVKSDHGLLPVPVPAVVRLLKGYLFSDDGIGGERITPTGAAILKFLNPSQSDSAMEGYAILASSGLGFGTKKLDGVSNVVRAVVYENDPNAIKCYQIGDILTIRFDIDDQSPEDLAVGLDNIRKLPDVVDVSIAMGIGKKGRFVSFVTVLALPNGKDAVLQACFRETTTAGLRFSLEKRAMLFREALETPNGRRVKTVQRTEGLTAKVEMDDIATLEGGHSERQSVRIAEENFALIERKKRQ